MDHERLYLTASDISISEKKSNDIFLVIDMRILSTRPNENNQGVTEAFIDEVVGNQEKYGCLPLYADVKRLLAKDYRSLGHMYNRITRRFFTTQIGGYHAFQKINDEYGVSLIGEARIPKREMEICQAIIELYAMGMLNFSFEIGYSKTNVIVENGVTYVDASDCNVLTGVAVVSIPAYKESVALSQVAEEVEDDEEKDTTDEQTDDEGAGKMTLEEAMTSIAEKEHKILDLETKVAVAEEKAKNVEDEKKVRDEQLSGAEDEKKKCEAELKAANEAITEKDAKIEELENKLVELEPVKTELETVKAELESMKAKAEEAELQKKQETAKAFAEKQGLDAQDEQVAKAIASLDYEAIASMVMKQTKSEDKPVTLASFMGNMEMHDKYGDLLSRR